MRINNPCIKIWKSKVGFLRENKQQVALDYTTLCRKLSHGKAKIVLCANISTLLKDLVSSPGSHSRVAKVMNSPYNDRFLKVATYKMLYPIEPASEAEGWMSGNAVNQRRKEDHLLSNLRDYIKMAVNIYMGFSPPWRNDGLKHTKNDHLQRPGKGSSKSSCTSVPSKTAVQQQAHGTLEEGH